MSREDVTHRLIRNSEFVAAVVKVLKADDKLKYDIIGECVADVVEFLVKEGEKPNNFAEENVKYLYSFLKWKSLQ